MVAGPFTVVVVVIVGPTIVLDLVRVVVFCTVLKIVVGFEMVFVLVRIIVSVSVEVLVLHLVKTSVSVVVLVTVFVLPSRASRGEASADGAKAQRARPVVRTDTFILLSESAGQLVKKSDDRETRNKSHTTSDCSLYHRGAILLQTCRPYVSVSGYKMDARLASTWDV